MAFNIVLGGHNGQAVNLGFNGRGDFSVGLRQAYGYGNGVAGSYGANEIGFGNRGLYAGGTHTNYNQVGVENRTWSANQWGSQSTYTAANVFGDYQNDRYAQNVFGGYQEGHTRASPWAVSNSEYAGNVYGGPQFQQHRYGDAWGWGGVSVPYFGHHHYHGCGGCQVGAWFGGGGFR